MSGTKQRDAGSYEVRVQPVERNGEHQWSVSMIRQGSGGGPTREPLLRVERFFDSNEAAVAYATAWISLEAPGRCTLVRGK